MSDGARLAEVGPRARPTPSDVSTRMKSRTGGARPGDGTTVDGRPAPPAAPTGPVRTCIGCRGRDLRSALLRVVRAGGEEDGSTVVVDIRRSSPGRGAWLHPDLQCLDLAERRRAFPRALRTGPLDTTPVRAHLEGGEPVQGPPRARPTSTEAESGLEADGPPMSTQR